jgi:hypothetical protein
MFAEARATTALSAAKVVGVLFAEPADSSCRTASAPMLKRPTRPVTLPPTSRSTGSPEAESPMLREKNGRPFSSSAPNSKISASCRKKSRFSGKKRPNRVRLTCRSSTSVAEKSVLIVSALVRLGVIL